MVLKKNSQISSQWVVLFLGLLIVAGIFLIGYKYIKGMGEKKEQTDLLQIKNQVRNDITSASMMYGNEKIAQYALPGKFNKLCFFDINKKIDFRDNLIINFTLDNGSRQNIFLLAQDNSFESFFVDKISIRYKPYYVCYKQEEGSVEVKFNGIKPDAYILSKIEQDIQKNFTFNKEEYDEIFEKLFQVEDNIKALNSTFTDENMRKKEERFVLFLGALSAIPDKDQLISIINAIFPNI